MSEVLEPFPVSLIHQLIEPGPTVMITTEGVQWPTIMTNGFNMPVRHDGTLAVIVGPWDTTYETLRHTGECAVEDDTLVDAYDPWILRAVATPHLGGVFSAPFESTPFGTVPPHGRQVTLTLINMFRYDSTGKLVEEWAQYGNLGWMRRLGVELTHQS